MADKPNPFAKSSKDDKPNPFAKSSKDDKPNPFAKKHPGSKKKGSDHGNALMAWLEHNKKKTKSKGKK